MPLPELIRRKAEKSLTRFCARRAATADDSASLRHTREGDSYVLWECVEPGRDGSDRAVALLRYLSDLDQWSLHYPDREGRWRLYLNSGPTLDLDRLLAHLETDPFQTFWT